MFRAVGFRTWNVLPPAPNASKDGRSPARNGGVSSFPEYAALFTNVPTAYVLVRILTNAPRTTRGCSLGGVPRALEESIQRSGMFGGVGANMFGGVSIARECLKISVPLKHSGMFCGVGSQARTIDPTP
jgi:hypothetical protein